MMMIGDGGEEVHQEEASTASGETSSLRHRSQRRKRASQEGEHCRRTRKRSKNFDDGDSKLVSPTGEQQAPARSPPTAEVVAANICKEDDEDGGPHEDSDGYEGLIFDEDEESSDSNSESNWRTTYPEEEDSSSSDSEEEDDVERSYSMTMGTSADLKDCSKLFGRMMRGVHRGRTTYNDVDDSDDSIDSDPSNLLSNEVVSATDSD